MSQKSYKGFYKLKNPNKYNGSHPIIFRSSWEYSVMKWLDENLNILKWGSETVIVPYSIYNGKEYENHRYFIDFDFTYKDGRKFLIEVKPKSQTISPKYRRSEKYIKECQTFIKNQYKWQAADIYAKKRGMIFEVWTEDVLKSKGIQLFK